MTGTRASAAMRETSDLPPRGMTTSINSGPCSMAPTLSRSVFSIRLTAAAGRPFSTNACVISLESAILLLKASLPPRRTQALPDLRQRAAASTVTLGRDS